MNTPKKEDIIKLISSEKNADIYDNNIVSIWLKELCKRDSKSMARLCANNEKRLTDILGKPSYVSKNQDWTNVWVVDDVGYPMIIYTGRTGTIYKVNYPSGVQGFKIDKKLGSQITYFLNVLVSKLSCSYDDGSQTYYGVNVNSQPIKDQRTGNT